MRPALHSWPSEELPRTCPAWQRPRQRPVQPCRPPELRPGCRGCRGRPPWRHRRPRRRPLPQPPPALPLLLLCWAPPPRRLQRPSSCAASSSRAAWAWQTPPFPPTCSTLQRRPSTLALPPALNPCPRQACGGCRLAREPWHRAPPPELRFPCPPHPPRHRTSTASPWHCHRHRTPQQASLQPRVLVRAACPGPTARPRGLQARPLRQGRPCRPGCFDPPG
mmetsp:Transcript_11302/g.33985  ORF Transcript_11302/g.33985 Transcript_11302/m.33985 type:complete len:221 (-) Transcript_11302:1159-1821(-)